MTASENSGRFSEAAWPAGSEVEPLLAGVMADLRVLAGAQLLILREPAGADDSGRLVAASSKGVEQYSGHPAARSFDQSGAGPNGGDGLTLIYGTELDQLADRLEMDWPDIRGAALIPLLSDGQSIGDVIMAFGSARRPSPKKRHALAALARQLSIALRQQRLSESLRKQAEESQVLLELAQVATSTLQPEEMLDQFIARAVALTSADKGSIWLLDEAGTQLIPAALFGMPGEFVAQWKRQRFALDQQPLSAEALRSREPIAIADAAEDARTDKVALDLFGERALLVVPILAADTPLGTLFLNNESRLDRHSVGEIRIAQSIAAQAGAAIRLAQLFAATDRGRRDLESAFRQFSQVLASGAEPEAVLQSLAELAAQMMRAEAATIYRARRGGIELAAWTGIDPPDASAAKPAPGPIARVIAQAAPVQADDARTLGGGLLLPSAAATTPYAYIATPLQVGERVVGAIAVARAGAPFGDGEIDLLASFARGAAAAAQRAEFQNALERRVVELSSLRRLAQVIAPLAGITHVVQTVTESVAALTQAERCVVMLRNPASGRLEAQAPAVGIRAETLGEMSLAQDSQAPALHALVHGETIISNDARGDRALADPHAALLRDVNVLIAPMRAGEEALGVVRVSNKAGGFGDDEGRLVSVFASQAAILIKNILLFEAELHEREQLEALLANASDGIVIADRDGRVIRLNPAAERISGWTQDTAAGRPVTEVLQLRGGDGQLAAAPHPMEWVLRERSTIAYSQQSLASRDGELVEVAASYAYVPGARDEPGLALGIVRDISTAKQVERMKSDFVSFVSHELRTPLSLIKGYVSTLLRRDLTLEEETQLRFLQGISDASDRLGLIVNNLLNASRIESGLFIPRLRTVELRGIVAPVVEEFQAQAVGRLTLVWEAGDARVLVDPEQMRIVLSNMLGNAIRYAVPHSEGPLVISARGAGEGVNVEISDAGPGIPAKDLPHVFEKFYRGSAEERSSVPGSGLGLFICRSIVEAHNGRVWLDSVPAEGTTVGFWLPVAAARTEDAHASRVSLPA